MNTTDDSGPVFPHQGYYGMTLRDYFAAKAMQCLIEGDRADDPSIAEDPEDDSEEAHHKQWLIEVRESYESSAKACYMLADAMLKARHE